MNLSKKEMKELEKSIEEMSSEIIKPIFDEMIKILNQLNELMYVLCLKGFLSKDEIIEIKQHSKEE